MKAQEEQEESKRILVVDDNLRNRELLSDLLEAEGYSVDQALNGHQCLVQVAKEQPDAILLDIMMPGIDGFEVCRRIKGIEETAGIPIIMLTALHERKDRLRGIEAGADDFLSKPIDQPDLLLRMRNALRMRRMFIKLRDNYQELRELEQLRDGLYHMIVHDLRAPIAAFDGYVSMLERRIEDPDQKVTTCLGYMHSVADKLTGMVNAVLDVSRMESDSMELQLESCNVDQVIDEAVQMMGISPVGVDIRKEGPSSTSIVMADREVLLRILGNLLHNAVKFSPYDGVIRVRHERSNEGVRVEVCDEGPGVPEEAKDRIFDKFGQLEARDHGRVYSTGLGLTFCKMAIEAHGGKIGTYNGESGGGIFWFLLPAHAPGEANPL